MTLPATQPDAKRVTVHRLQAWGLIHASGADAEAFLHAQLTNDLVHLGVDDAQWTGYCTAKGRLLSTFLLWRDGAGGFMLACDRALLPGLVKRLRMFVMRAKVTIADVGDTLALTGEIGGHIASAMQVRRNGTSVRITLPAVEGSGRTLVADAPPADNAQHFDSDGAWMRAMIAAGEAWITPATSEHFVPQMVNFDAIGGVNFKKGCYPGQEVVARAHYRGAVKRRMYLARVGGVARAGQPLFAADLGGQESGLIVNAAPGADGECLVLAVLPITSRHSAAIHLGSPDGPLLAFEELPYQIPEPA